ncbi:MAG: chorismate mutase [Gemmatimonadota bacterium]|nr:chorismate mutase [Gemmatimonadota bacterium]
MGNEIGHWRIKIDEIDETLIELFNRRAEHAIEIGRIKSALGMPVHNPQRENQIYDHVKALNPGPLSDGAIRRLFERIIDETRRLEREVCEKEGTCDGNRDEA